MAGTVDTADVDRWWRSVAPRVERLVAAAAQATAILAERYLIAHGAAHGVTVRPVRALPAADQIATSLRVSGPVGWKIAFADAKGDPTQATTAMRTKLAGTAVRLALAGERDTTMATFGADDGEA